MEKINWINGQAGGTPLSAENLNQMQDNIEEAIDEVDDKLNYSTTETCVREWIDGKSLYMKVVNLGTLPNNDTKAVAHGIQNLRRIVKLEGFAGSSLNKGGITLPHATNTPIALYADDTNVSVKTTSDATGYTEAYAFVYYTKTTD
ncbi:MAG: hypothetical protein IJH39_11515 [Clostridia bacterium]|nr:hypothetical protein [Clostridia bacterium]